MLRLKSMLSVVLGILFVAALSSCASTSTRVNGHDALQTDAEKLVSRAAETVRRMRAESDWFDGSLDDAQAVLIFPSYVRIGYLGSLAGAKGVLMVRDTAGFWSAPAFYSMGQLGGGLQIGVEYGAIVYVIRDPTLVPDLTGSRWQFDAQASVVVLSTNRGHLATEMTEKLRAVLFTDMDGLFAGVSLDGAYVDSWDAGMNQFHGVGMSATDVLLAGKGCQDKADALMDALQGPIR